MNETNEDDKVNAKPNESEVVCSKNGDDDDIPTFVENSKSKMHEEFDESKTEKQHFHNETKSIELEVLQIERPITEILLSSQDEPQSPDDGDFDEKRTKLPEEESTIEKEATTGSSSIEIKFNDEDKVKKQSLIDDTEDLLVPTDFVPDISDVITSSSDETKRKYSYCDDGSDKCKKFKLDTVTNEEDISMQNDNMQNNFNKMCIENVLPSDTSPEKTTETIKLPEECRVMKEELSITDILVPSGIASEKTIALADIIESVDDLIKKDNEKCESDNSDSTMVVAAIKQVQQNADEIEKSSENFNNPANELDFMEISEKLKVMDEISLAPVSKIDRKPLPEFDLSAEISLEQISKKSISESDDKRNKVSNLRKNIREVMDDNQLDASTLAAQREELERLARVQEQQRIIREMQRQVALDRQNSKTQNKVLSLLTGHNTSHLLKSNSATSGTKVQAMTSPMISSADVAEIHSVSIAPIKSSQKKFDNNEISDISGSIEIQNEVDLDSDEKLDKPSDGLLIVEESTDEDNDEEDDDDVIELKPKKDIVTIDDSSDDDCIMLSDDEEEDEGDDDPQNSGLHVNDAYNVPDEQGRVVINIGHPEGENDIFLAPQIARIIKPHQIGGVRFLFDNIIESVERFSTSTGFGCILAHSMGLGKTLQLVCFIDIFLRHTNSNTILCIMPINTLQNWLAEFNMWIPEDAENSPLKAQGEVRPRNFKLFVLNDTHKTLNARSKIVLEWARSGGVLLIGYELYRLLSLKKVTKRRGRKTKIDPEVEEREAEEHKKLLDEMHAALVKPGPDLVVCDEGHRIKNSHASISVALKQIRSKRRIVLTGYPLQNNLLEYWCMVDFVRPNYLGTKTEFSNMFERPIQNGQCIDSTPQDIKLMRYRAHVLHSLLLGFVQRRSHVVLQNSLPQKEEFVILVRMTPFQRKLYDVFMNEVVRTKAVPNPLKAFAVCCKIWNHPDVLYNFLKKREADLDLEEAEASANDASFDVTTSETTNKNTKKKTTNKKNKRGEKPTNSSMDSEIKTDLKPAASVPPNTVGGIGKSASEKEVNEYLKTEISERIKSETSNADTNLKTNKISYDQLQQQLPLTPSPPPPPETHNFTNSNPGNSPQYNRTSYNPSQTSNSAYNHANYPYPPAVQSGFSTPYSNYNRYDHYNSYHQPNSSIPNRYYWNQSHQQQTRPYDFNTINDSKGHQSEFGQTSCYSHNNQQYGYSQHMEYQTGGSFSPYGTMDYHHSMYNIPQTSGNQTLQSNYSYNQSTNSNQWNISTSEVSPQSASIGPHVATIQQQQSGNNNSNQINIYGKNTNQSDDTTSTIKNSNSNQTSKIQTNAHNGNLLQSNYSNLEQNSNHLTNNLVKTNSSETVVNQSSETKDEKIKTQISDKGNEDETEDKKFVDIKEENAEKLDAKVKDDGIPYDWAIELMKNYTPDLIENSTKMEIFFCILEETISLGDRMLIFSQSLLTLNLIERFLQANPAKVTENEIKWSKNINYYRLDGSTGAQEREKLINEFNSNQNVHLFLVSTRAGSLGINLVGANRVVVFDASWNPCHDTQAVCRIFRYGQRKPCFVYRLVMDNCLEKKIYDRQVNKQGMSDRVIDECNPDARLSMKEVTNLCYDDEKETDVCDFSGSKEKYCDIVMKKVIELFSTRMTKEPFQHESLLIDRKEKKLSMAEKRLAQRGYELEKQAASKPSYTIYNANRQQIGTYRATRPDGVVVTRPVASVRPIQADTNRNPTARPTRWIPAEVWQRQGMTAQVLTLPGDVVIPTSSADKQNIILKEGQKVMVLKSPKGIYMQLESGKIIAIRTALKVGHNKDKTVPETTFMAREMQKRNPVATSTKVSNTSTIVCPTTSNTTVSTTMLISSKATSITPSRHRSTNHVQFGRNNSVSTNKNVQMGTAKPYNLKSRNVVTTSDATAILQTQYNTSNSRGNSNSSFDADISDDSQFLEKLGENLAAKHQNSVEDAEQMNKSKELKCSENMIESASNEHNTEIKSQKSYLEKVDNGVAETSINTINDEASGACHSESKYDVQIGHSYHDSRTENYSNINRTSSASYLPQQNYNYENYNSNGNYNDTTGHMAQHIMQPNMNDSEHPERYSQNNQQSYRRVQQHHQQQQQQQQQEQPQQQQQQQQQQHQLHAQIPSQSYSMQNTQQQQNQAFENKYYGQNQPLYSTEKISNGTQKNVSSLKPNQSNQNYGNICEPYNGKIPLHVQGNIQQTHYQQQYYLQNKYPSKTSSSSSMQQQTTSNTIPSGPMSNSFGHSSNSANYNNYSHTVVTSYQQNYEYNSPSSSSISTMNYATPSPVQYSFASSSPSANTTQVPSPDIRQQNVVHSSSLPSIETQHESNREFPLSNQYKLATDNKAFNPTQKSNYNSTDVMSGHYTTSDNCAYSVEMKSSLKKYRHKQQTNNKTQPIYGGGSNEFKMEDHYGATYSTMEPLASESTLSILEKTASSIDESKSAFKASLSNITKPNTDMLTYGTQSLYGNSNASQAPVKAKTRARGRKTGNKAENLLKSEPITSSPVSSLPMKKNERISASSTKVDDVIESHSKSIPVGWSVDEAHIAKKLNPADNYSSSIGVGLHSISSNEKNLTIPHTDVNTTYNHTDQTYQYSGQTPALGPTSPFLLSHSQNKPESSMYSSHGEDPKYLKRAIIGWMD
ncbi:uncharacterized protein LOC116349266 isoform X4 [Contarinia nasturtii]|uniref:uncharacterized protein LOC116349266 isoform X4 n=1 Tax=Contarinia nasturtii TaxID=265458 RepID=UPI0012D3BFC2|nr:uncharacterized protein LOC116349266 isoform X4 [Contarinia nasturtii]